MVHHETRILERRAQPTFVLMSSLPSPSLPAPPLAPVPRLAPGFAWAGVGAGRLALRGRPKLALVPHLRSLGCDRLVTLLSAHEGALSVGRAAQEANLAWTWTPLENGRSPEGTAHRELARTAIELAARLAEGEGVLIHCAAGLHRTGMLAYAVLRLLGLPPEAARAAVAEARRETAEAMREHHVAWGDELADGNVVRAASPKGLRSSHSAASASLAPGVLAREACAPTSHRGGYGPARAAFTAATASSGRSVATTLAPAKRRSSVSSAVS
jgi:predicted protein tyrosine phosphatase